MKKITLSSIIAVITALPALALAQMEQIAPGGPGGTVGSLQQIIHAIENAVGLVFGALAVIMFVFAGVRFLTAGGEPEKVQQARSAVLWGVAGVVVGIIAFSIIAIVGSVIR